MEWHAWVWNERRTGERVAILGWSVHVRGKHGGSFDRLWWAHSATRCCIALKPSPCIISQTCTSDRARTARDMDRTSAHLHKVQVVHIAHEQTNVCFALIVRHGRLCRLCEGL
eukprot:COSAG01_NODE_3342_length_6229_cov_4.142088_3_plen_113_part_00